MTCEYPDCKKIFWRMPSATSQNNYCSGSHAAIMNNRLYPKRSRLYKKCANSECSKIFKKPTIYCSVNCKNISARSYTSDELIRILKMTAIKLKRTPAKRELPEICGAVVNTFGSWNAGIKAADLEFNRSDSQRMYKRTKTVALDGHRCDSISEAIIDNWLSDNNIAHERNVQYPDTNHKADWGIEKGIFIEYFGLANDSPRYDKEIKIKREICSRYKIKLIEIYSKDIYPKPKLSKKFLSLV